MEIGGVRKRILSKIVFFIFEGCLRPWCHFGYSSSLDIDLEGKFCGSPSTSSNYIFLFFIVVIFSRKERGGIFLSIEPEAYQRKAAALKKPIDKMVADLFRAVNAYQKLRNL